MSDQINEVHRLEFTGDQIDQLLRKILNSGKPLTITINGETIEYDGITGSVSVNIDTESGVTTHDSDINAHSDIREAIEEKYTKPAEGIPKSDLDSTIQISLGKADSAYQAPEEGIPSSAFDSAVRVSLNKADSAYQLPENGIPSSDLSAAVQAALNRAIMALQSTDIDSTLIATGKAADAVTVGRRLAAIDEQLTAIQITINNYIPDDGYVGFCVKGS